MTSVKLSGARALLCALACGALPLTSAAQEGGGDVVYLRDGTTLNGEVTAQSYKELTFQEEGGAKKTLPWTSVQSVDYFDAPDELTSGLAMLSAGNLEEALKEIAAVLGTEELRPFVVQDALVLQAHLHQRLGQAAPAREAYAKLLHDFPKGHHLLTAGENLIALHMQANDAPGAHTALDGLSASLKDEPGAEPVLGLLDAGLLLAEGKNDAALERYRSVENATGADPSLVEEARLGRARILLATNKAAEAEPLLKALVVESVSARVQSGAWNELGELEMVAGRTKKDGDLILTGLYDFLRTVVQYKPLPGETTAPYERALAGASKCFQLLSELEQNAEKKKLLLNRKRERVELLQREFPNSPYLRQI